MTEQAPDRPPVEPEASPPQEDAGHEPTDHEPTDHEPTGLELAHEIARSVGSQVRRRKSKPRQVTEPQSSGARPDDRDPQLLGTALERMVETKGWATDINVHTLLGRWALLVGTTNAAHSQPETYADQVLTVRTDSTVWAASLRAMAPQLVAILNDKLGDGTVRRVKILGPEAPSWKKGRLSVRDGRGPRDTYG